VAALASLVDLSDRIGTLTAAQTARAPALLDDASALVRRYTRQDFELVTNDAIVLRPVGGVLRLPQRPVVAVDSVAMIKIDGTPGPPFSGWSWDGLDKITITGHGIAGLVDPFWPWAIELAGRTYQVIYDHGEALIPDDVIAVVANMVNRVLTAPSLTEGLQAERLGEYSYQAQQGAAAVSGTAVRLTQGDKDDLIAAGYRRRSTTVQVR
jgi:hypothetical protein